MDYSTLTPGAMLAEFRRERRWSRPSLIAEMGTRGYCFTPRQVELVETGGAVSADIALAILDTLDVPEDKRAAFEAAVLRAARRDG